MLSDEALYERLLGGGLAAFDALYERYERRLFGFILKHIADRHEAEDVLHDAFISVLRERRAVTCFRAWLFQITRNLCLNRQRSRQRAARAMEAAALAPATPSPHPERALQQAQSTEALRQAVSRLPSRLGEPYQLRAGGLSYEELAQVLEG
jgi:RNA polymerase sigma-70 factor, ECF subfamily